MKYKIILIALLLMTLNSVSMEQKDTNLKGILLTTPSLKFLAAWAIAQRGPIVIEQVGEEGLLRLIGKIRSVQSCTECSDDEKKLFINLINNPDISNEAIQKFFPGLIKKYLKSKEFKDTKQLLNAILLENSSENKTSLVQLSLDYADVNSRDYNGLSALIWAVGDNNKEIVQRLLAQGADINIKSRFNVRWTALIAAVYKGHKEIAQLLLDNGANVNDQDVDDNTVLMISADKGQEEIVKRLLDKGADVNIRNIFGITALMRAMNSRNKEIVNMLLDKGSDIDAKDNYGFSVLMKAVINNNTEVIPTLLDHGVDVNMQNADGLTALQLAEERGYNEIADMLKNKMTKNQSTNNVNLM